MSTTTSQLRSRTTAGAGTTAGTAGKTASTSVPLHPLLAERWSPRALDGSHELSVEQLTALLEAARWAPSASNTQPWRFATARRGSDAFAALYEALAPGNQLWAHAASALIVVAAEVADDAGKARPWAAYDTGQAVAHLNIQAQHEGLAIHQMGGFDHDRVAELLRLPENVQPLVVLVVGQHDASVELDEPLASREAAERSRLPLDRLVLPLEVESPVRERRAA
jgi:nitroreductase